MHVDVSGTVCPLPVRIVRRCLEELETGEELVVTGDYPPAERSIRRTCHRHGYAVAAADDGTSDDAETFSLRIRVTEQATLSPDGSVSNR
ncbi:sulfurtransferase TusA family protein [Natrinema salifodinae]|uniref:tRNA 2-thiouridine synthesizing protein A n=1 Tax=Natrinema salifodinae TaxID=1202768 RepID=A0A1I0QSR8_9EURY|nr:sulfurtransferase TusA family protein [Natrinema salifodinae]SEW29970.1 tRNA 2-thiouridine synthesizing protein A [Natrinema salifodinae]